MKNNCKHEGPRHMVEHFDKGYPEKLWMCAECGEIVGNYRYRNTSGCEYISDKHHWIKRSGAIVSEYA